MNARLPSPSRPAQGDSAVARHLLGALRREVIGTGRASTLLKLSRITGVHLAAVADCVGELLHTGALAVQPVEQFPAARPAVSRAPDGAPLFFVPVCPACHRARPARSPSCTLCAADPITLGEAA